MEEFLEDVLAKDDSVFTGVVEVLELGGTGSFLGCSVFRKQRVHVFLEPGTALGDIRKVTLLGCPLFWGEGFPKLVQSMDTAVFLHKSFDPENLVRVRETCVGIGALGAGLRHLGLKICAQNDLQPATCREAALISQLSVIEGDICEDATVNALWNQCPGDAILAARVSCQPYSRLGDQRGGSDPRSASLVGCLRAAHLLQSSAVLLECVEPAATHPFVQNAIQRFCRATGFHCSQVVLPLHLIWTARRTRWWALLTSQRIGQVQVLPWKAHGPWHAVEDIMDCLNVTPTEASQLMLSDYEVACFQELKPLSDYMLRRNQPLPTALHSWGSPLSCCPCGCRGPFSWERLRKGGICSVVVPFEGDIMQGKEGLRYLSAAEVSLLNGFSPLTAFGADCRLSLALVGQLASPLQAAWMTMPLLNRLRDIRATFSPPFDPLQVVEGQRRLLLCEAETASFRPFSCDDIAGLGGSTQVSDESKAAFCAATGDLPPRKKRKCPQLSVSGHVSACPSTATTELRAPDAASGRVSLASLSNTVVDFLCPGSFLPQEGRRDVPRQPIATSSLASKPAP